MLLSCFLRILPLKSFKSIVIAVVLMIGSIGIVQSFLEQLEPFLTPPKIKFLSYSSLNFFNTLSHLHWLDFCVLFVLHVFIPPCVTFMPTTILFKNCFIFPYMLLHEVTCTAWFLKLHLGKNSDLKKKKNILNRFYFIKI